MIALSVGFFQRFSVISLCLYFLRRIRKGVRMALASASKQSSSSSSSNALSSQAKWIASLLYNPRKKFEGNRPKRQKSIKSPSTADNNHPQNKSLIVNDQRVQSLDINRVVAPEINTDDVVNDPGNDEMIVTKRTTMLRKRPTQLVLPALSCPAMDFSEFDKKFDREEFQAQGKGFALASKKGKRQVMEDGHGVMLDISGNPKQAFFVVVDGHGGRAAADFVAENLGRNIMKEIEDGVNENVVGLEDEHQIEAAVVRGYLLTDHQFLSQKVVKGGACAASVLVKDGELYVANVGDCKVILSRKGKAHCLTQDHRLTREDERVRIESSGGFVECRNGVWRVNGSLAVSRAIGDIYLKDHVISEPHTLRLPLTSDAEFLILASDGLWDQVGEQEAVDVVVESISSTGNKKEEERVEACKELVAMSYRRGGLDDVTVMVIHLPQFLPFVN